MPLDFHRFMRLQSAIQAISFHRALYFHQPTRDQIVLNLSGLCEAEGEAPPNGRRDMPAGDIGEVREAHIIVTAGEVTVV